LRAARDADIGLGGSIAMDIIQAFVAPERSIGRQFTCEALTLKEPPPAVSGQADGDRSEHCGAEIGGGLSKREGVRSSAARHERDDGQPGECAT